MASSTEYPICSSNSTSTQPNPHCVFPSPLLEPPHSPNHSSVKPESHPTLLPLPHYHPPTHTHNQSTTNSILIQSPFLYPSCLFFESCPHRTRTMSESSTSASCFDSAPKNLHSLCCQSDLSEMQTCPHRFPTSDIHLFPFPNGIKSSVLNQV